MRCPVCGYETVPEEAEVCPRCLADLSPARRGDTNVIVDVDVGIIESGGQVTGLEIGKAGDIYIGLDRSREAQERRNRLLVLEIVWTSWIEGVLEQIEATHAALTSEKPLIQLSKRWLPEAVLGRSDADDEIAHLVREQAASLIDEPIDEIFDESGDSLLILGQPGSGKTVSLLELARERLRQAWQNDEEPIPIVLNLASWSEKRMELADWIVHELNTPQYGVPKDIGLDWLERDEILLLLDGLDEIPHSLRDDCVRAINRFSEKHFARIAVCSRYEEYITLTDGRSEDPLRTRLQLRRAILLEPLTSEQITDYFNAAGDNLAALRQTLQEDMQLEELIKAPLILAILSVTYEGVTPDRLPTEQLHSTQAWRDQLFDAYEERMFTYKSAEEQPFEKSQTVSWLSWLAQGMNRHNQSLFQIERLQPSWLPSVRWQLGYVMASRLFITLIGATVGGLVLGIANGITGGGQFVILGLVQGLTGGLIAGLVCGVIDAIWLMRPGKDQPARPKSRLGQASTKFMVIVACVWVAVIFGFGILSVVTQGTALRQIFSLEQGLQVGLILALSTGWIFAFGPAEARHELSNDIQTVERLNWSRERAIQVGIRGTVIGLVAGIVAAFVARGTPLVQPVESRLGTFPIVILIMMLIGAFFIGLAAIVLGGFRGNVVEIRKLHPNQGLYTSIYNAGFTMLAIGGLFGILGVLLGWVIGGWQIAVTMGLYGLFFGVIAALWYGGFFIVQHATLRAMLWWLGYTPRLGQFTRFLDYAARRVFLRKVGGGYIFIHRYLQEHFAKKDVR